MRPLPKAPHQKDLHPSTFYLLPRNPKDHIKSLYLYLAKLLFLTIIYFGLTFRFYRCIKFQHCPNLQWQTDVLPPHFLWPFSNFPEIEPKSQWQEELQARYSQ